MNHTPGWTLTRYLIEERRRYPAASGELNALILDIALACKAISRIVAAGELAEVAATGVVNVQGEMQKPLDVLSNDLFLRMNEWSGHLAGMASEEMEDPRQIPAGYPRGKYLLVFDPLDGSGNVDVNASVGSIFSILRAPAEPGDRVGQCDANGQGDAAGQGDAFRQGDAAEAALPEQRVAPVRDATEADFLQPGRWQVAAGYAIYGPSTQLVLTVGNGVVAFTLDPTLGEFILTRRTITIPEHTSEFAINSSNSRFWEPPVKRFVEECLAGVSGPRGKDFNMRWIACVVAEAHRILMRGGVFLYPRDTRDPSRHGRLRLLYEANPIGMLVEQAGGLASTGRQPVLDLVPASLHQRIGLVFGSRTEVERIERYHREGTLREPSPTLFGERSLFRN